MLNFVFIRGMVSFILVAGVWNPPKPLNLSQNMRVRRLLASRCASFLSLCGAFLPPSVGKKKCWGFLDPCGQNETYHTLNEDKIEHMNET